MTSAAQEEGGAAHVPTSGRVAVVAGSACALVTVIAGIFALSQISGADFLALVIPLPFAFALAYGLTRHVPLAAVASVGPVAGVLWGDAIGLLFGVPLAAPSLALVFGGTLSFVFADCIVARTLDGDDPRTAARTAVMGSWRPLLGGAAIAFAMLTVAVRDPWFRQISLSNFLQLAGSGVAAVAVSWSAASYLVFSEDFVTRLNRVREARTRRAYAISLISMPRWGLSVAGIGLVAAVLGFFGAEGTLAAGGWAVFTVLLLALLLSFSLSGQWRNALALLFAVAVSALIGFWSWTELASSGLPDVVALLEAVAVSFALMLAVVSRERALGVAHNQAVARLLAAEELTTPVVYIAAAMILPTIMLGGSGGLAAVALIGGVACALLLAPAATTAFETLVPRRKSITELYGSQT
jgi:hypothetical protein